jgi:hypothetical protein
MKKMFLGASLLLAMTVVPSRMAAQGPDGSDINKAIPIYFGQLVSDIGDSGTKAVAVYSITLAKGQTVTLLSSKLTGAAGNSNWSLFLLRPSTVSIKNYSNADILDCRGINCSAGSNNAQAQSFTYLVSTAGTYYIMLQFGSSSIPYSLVVAAQGTPIAVPNPPTAGCLTGRVDYITYSLQLIAVGLPDEVSIGGQKACASCTVKAPLYPEIVNRLENALKAKVNAEACYDSAGNIFQIKLVQ